MTVQLWGEMAQGEWKLVVASSDQMGKNISIKYKTLKLNSKSI